LDSIGRIVRVIGIDPGLTRTGYGVVERVAGGFAPVGFGVVRTARDRPAAERLADLAAEITAVIDLFSPAVAAVERVFFNSNVKTAMSVGQASGVVLASAARAGLGVATYTPTEVKQSVVGFGSATKDQIGAMVCALLRLDSAPSPPDAADACALAICHINRSGLARAISRAEREGVG
jgi:crossover junction endodeoxyribonuclease RuvC